MGTLNSPALEQGAQEAMLTSASFDEEQVKLLSQAGISFFTSWFKVAHMLGGSYSTRKLKA
jgi:hypothetical protein